MLKTARTGDDLEVLARVVRTRRSNLGIEREQPVPDDLVMSLCELATWAPCHKRTWPWVFASFTGAARRRLGDVVADALQTAGAESARVDKTRTKYERAPVVLAVGSTDGGDPVRTAENRDAVSAGIQNLLLAATAAGLASYWSSCPSEAEQAVADAAGFPESAAIVALVYLGWPGRECAAPERPPASVNWLR